jgi:hypothetical protein
MNSLLALLLAGAAIWAALFISEEPEVCVPRSAIPNVWHMGEGAIVDINGWVYQFGEGPCLQSVRPLSKYERVYLERHGA